MYRGVLSIMGFDFLSGLSCWNWWSGMAISDAQRVFGGCCLCTIAELLLNMTEWRSVFACFLSFFFVLCAAFPIRHEQ